MENGTAEQPAVNAVKKPKLTRLKIESFRNVDPCELRFGDGFNVLLGLNATGKTTLLELITAALSFDFSKFKQLLPWAADIDYNESIVKAYQEELWNWGSLGASTKRWIYFEVSQASPFKVTSA